MSESFVADVVVCGRVTKALRLVDDDSRMNPGIAVDLSNNGHDAMALPDQINVTVGQPRNLALDGGPELIANALDDLTYQN